MAQASNTNNTIIIPIPASTTMPIFVKIIFTSILISWSERAQAGLYSFNVCQLSLILGRGAGNLCLRLVNILLREIGNAAIPEAVCCKGIELGFLIGVHLIVIIRRLLHHRFSFLSSGRQLLIVQLLAELRRGRHGA